MQTEFQSHRLLAASSDFGQSLIFDRDYDAFGNQIRLSANVGGDVSGGSIIGGVWDFENEYTFDGQNRLTSIAQSSVLGGNAVAAKLAEYAYDPASQRTDLKRYSSYVLRHGGAAGLPAGQARALHKVMPSLEQIAREALRSRRRGVNAPNSNPRR